MHISPFDLGTQAARRQQEIRIRDMPLDTKRGVDRKRYDVRHDYAWPERPTFRSVMRGRWLQAAMLLVGGFWLVVALLLFMATGS